MSQENNPQDSKNPEQPQNPEVEQQTDANQEDTLEETVLMEENLAEKYSELEAKVSQYHDELLRARAEMENIRRRAQDDVVKARKFSTESFAESLVPVKDSLEAALAIENQTLEALKEGVESTLRQLNQAFERNHLKEVAPAVGDKFDPNLHQAISSVPSEEVEANCVLQSLQKGYTIADRVLRPALVMVSAGKQ
ncbi:nucleotide exchange factor GrpE [Advenella sp. RU8]|uniref:nucleotide exchange factor GrpE n=1 Tax=Advenella sp. RU8 TaxID=3399575 RepID=UPI003AAFEBD8